ncbi:hypothetical protein MRB53_037952 [Persea americana]|nr:hypothetical protein MRB53_037952 [Persea americana]
MHCSCGEAEVQEDYRAAEGRPCLVLSIKWRLRGRIIRKREVSGRVDLTRISIIDLLAKGWFRRDMTPVLRVQLGNTQRIKVIRVVKECRRHKCFECELACIHSTRERRRAAMSSFQHIVHTEHRRVEGNLSACRQADMSTRSPSSFFVADALAHAMNTGEVIVRSGRALKKLPALLCGLHNGVYSDVPSNQTSIVSLCCRAADFRCRSSEPLQRR